MLYVPHISERERKKHYISVGERNIEACSLSLGWPFHTSSQWEGEMSPLLCICLPHLIYIGENCSLSCILCLSSLCAYALCFICALLLSSLFLCSFLIPLCLVSGQRGEEMSHLCLCSEREAHNLSLSLSLNMSPLLCNSLPLCHWRKEDASNCNMLHAGYGVPLCIK